MLTYNDLQLLEGGCFQQTGALLCIVKLGSSVTLTKYIDLCISCQQSQPTATNSKKTFILQILRQVICEVVMCLAQTQSTIKIKSYHLTLTSKYPWTHISGQSFCETFFPQLLYVAIMSDDLLKTPFSYGPARFIYFQQVSLTFFFSFGGKFSEHCYFPNCSYNIAKYFTMRS